MRYDIDHIDLRDDELIQRFAALAGPVLDRYFKPTVRGLDRIPEGAALYVGNHNGGLLTPDTFTFGLHVLRERGVDFVPYGLGHEVAISLPIFHQLLIPLGAVRACHENALRLFEAGRKVLVYPSGDLDAMRPYRHRERVVFGNRRGYIRLALRGRVPIVPVVSAGAHETFLLLDDGRWLARLLRVDKLLRLKVFPITLSIPWGLTVGPPPTHLPLPTHIYTEVLDPIELPGGPAMADDRDHVEHCHHLVHDRMEQALRRLSEERRRGGGRVLL